jgi:hypothetical protein
VTDFKYEERIDGAKEAIKRSRSVFLILTIVSVALLIAAWNAYFSWTREIPLRLHSFPTDEVAAHAQRHLIDEWVSSQMIGIPLLGIRVGVGDAAPLGGLSVLILTIWFYFATRLENRAIGELLIDTLDETTEVKSRIFHSISSYLVFITIATSDLPISSLRAPAQTLKPFGALRAMVKILAFLAPFAILVIVACDTATIFWLKSPYRAGHLPLIKQGDISLYSWVEWGSIELIALTFAGFAAFLCVKSLGFTHATANILDEYSKLVRGAAHRE